jgi:hypothetical protein
MNGYQTHIFESHDKPGGVCTSWKRKDYIVDGCIHWLIGSTKDSSVYQIWEELGAVQGREFVIHEEGGRIEGREKVLTTYRDLDRLEEHLLALRRAKARDGKKPVLWGLGAHVIKTGLSPILIDLMDRGFISGIALNGAGMIHDFEIALIGSTRIAWSSRRGGILTQICGVVHRPIAEVAVRGQVDNPVTGCISTESCLGSVGVKVFRHRFRGDLLPSFFDKLNFSSGAGQRVESRIEQTGAV